MSRAIVPIAQLGRRLPELGRLKFGDTNAKGGRRTIDKWRVVSNHEDCLADIANLYGGKPKPYSHPKSDLRFDVHTTSDVLDVGLATYSGQDIVSLCYELWSGKGCERRCNGQRVTTWAKGPDGPEEREGDCLCVAAGEMSCGIKLRVSFFLPGVARFGVWRLETGSWNAVAEMRGMAELLISLQARGITQAELALAPRHDVKGGQTRNFVVPEIRLRQNFEALAAGEGRIGTIGSGATAQIGAGSAADVPPTGGRTPEIPASSAGEPAPPEHISLNQALSEREVVQPELVGDDDPWKAHNPRARALAGKAGWDDDAWHQAIHDITEGRTSTSRELTVEEWADLLAVLEAAEPAANGFPAGWSDRAGPDKARATKMARQIAEGEGVAAPGSFDEIGAALAVAVVEAGA